MFVRDSLCERCLRMRPVVSGRGSRFLLCGLGLTDPRFPKYPPQPQRNCPGFEAKPPEPAPDEAAGE